ncbi:uncharacterized protein LOC118700565 [Molothrus ater]|uniref:uncharacterized protein LOC118700565 n=1 Tax=Molothrus ater TaxID=84834 RepID=UPI0023E7FA06|nr:uncharacterized protein LOC118700565 [Molothrus ater]
MADRFLSPFKVFRGKKKNDPGATQAQQPEDLEQIRTLEDDAALDKTQEQQPGPGRLRQTLKRLRKFLHIRRRKTGTSAAEGKAEPDSGLTELQAEPDVSPDSAERSQDFDTSVTESWAKALLTSMTEDVVITNSDNEETEDISNTVTMPTPIVIHAPTMDFFEDSAVPSQQQVPAIVRSIHQRLVSHVALDARLQIDIVRLAEEHPADVVLTLLRCAPTCDREMFRIFIPLCSLIAIHLLKRLHREEPRWDLPFLAFFVEVFQCLDLRKCGDSTLEIMSRHLQSECREQRRLALRGLVVLSKDPLRARRMCSLSKNLVELLGDAEGYVVSMTLSVLTNILENEHILISSTTAPKLAEALLPLFDCDDIDMQLLSLNLFFKVMDLVVNKRKKTLKKIVSQSLLPLFFHCHDENKRVAKASRELLLCVVEFLKKRKLKQLLEREKMLKFANCLLAEDRSRVAEHLRRALHYLRSPQEPLREAAVRFMGSAKVLMRGQKEELEVLNEAIHTQKKGSLSHCSRNIQAQFTSRAEELSLSSGSSESVTQEQHQETLKRTPSPIATGVPGTDDDWHS